MAYYFEPPSVRLNAPPTVAGDLIVGRADGNFDRLAIGANGTFLNVSAGVIRWGNVIDTGGLRVTAGNVGIQSGTPLNALVVGGTGNGNTDAGMEVSVGSAISVAAYNRNSSAYATLTIDAAIINLRPNGTSRLQIGTTGVTNYNNIATGGWGLPAIYGQGRATAQVAANASLATFTPAADGSFVVSANVLVTASATHTFSIECAYTDEGGTARVVTFNVQQLGGTLVTSITNITGAGPYDGVPLHIRAKGGTSITIRTNAAGTYTSVTYNAEGAIVQIA